MAEFTAGILTELAERFDLTLWTGTREYDRLIAPDTAVRLLSDFAATAHEHEAINIFNIGNDRAFHETIFKLSRKHPGIVILHDLDLPELRARFSLSARKISPLQLALERALGAMVHSGAALKTVRAYARCPVLMHSLPYSAVAAAPARLQDRHDSLRLIIFGFLDANRRIETVLRALHSYSRKTAVHLDIYGIVSKLPDLQRLVEELALSEIVTFHGFVSPEQIDQALDRADLAINLRHPTMGEASGSQLKIWDHALPSLVTPTGSYLDLPSGTVGYVNLATEIADLHEHFDAIQRDPEFYRRIGEKGRATLISNHRPADYVGALARLVEEARSFSNAAHRKESVQSARN
ncbi:MAG: hypothetical protein QOI04_2272 [Verrucomicrobiota bacterium]